MTPTDSGSHALCADPDCDLCAANRAIKPDSSDREAKEIPCPCIGWPTIRLLIADGQVRFDDVALVAADDLFRCDFVPVPLPLTQRILAALEEEADTNAPFVSESRLRALAAELRARVEGK